MEATGAALLVVSLVAVALPFAVYPAVVRLVGGLRSPVRAPDGADYRPHVTIIVAFCGGGQLLRRKLANLSELDYPRERLDVMLAADGPLDPEDQATVDAAATGSLRVRSVALPGPQGKAHALNLGAHEAFGEVLVFSDLDAALPADALAKLTRWFALPDVGGICGQRVIEGAGGVASAGQSAYVGLDSQIKQLENRLGAITSNDGKLYAIRRTLFRPVHPTATDDLYSALSVIGQGYRFLFDAEARALIPPPSWTTRHDLDRRRRVVVRSLSGIFARPARLLELRFGLFGPRLLVNKVLRRLLPVFLAGLLAGCLLLAHEHAWAAALSGVQVAFYLGGAAFAAVDGRASFDRLPGPLKRGWQAAFYVCLGMAGMLLGVLDFLRGKRIARWTPKKTA